MRQALPVNETRLLHEVARAYPELAFDGLTHERLRALVAERGIDFATALFYDRVRRASPHAAFIREIEETVPDLERLPRLRGKVLIAPGAFYREYPEFGADGPLVREVAREFGLAADLLPVSSTCPVSDAAECVATALARKADGSILLVSLSKGGADMRLALDRHPEIAAKVAVWVNICGTLCGSPVVNHLLGSPGRSALFRAYFALRRADFRLLTDLRHGPGALLGSNATVPAGLRVVNVVACPLRSHLTGSARLRARHARITPLGPNDGSTLLLDAVAAPGVIYPVWAADHYFRVPALSDLLYRLFLWCHRSARVAPIVPKKNRPVPIAR